MITLFRNFKCSEKLLNLLSLPEIFVEHTSIMLAHESDVVTSEDKLHYIIYENKSNKIIAAETIPNYEYRKLFPISAVGKRRFYKYLQYAPEKNRKI